MAAAPPALAVEVSKAEMDQRRCLNCHGQSRLATAGASERITMVSRAKDGAPTTQPIDPGPRAGLFVTRATLSASVHANLSCVDCHTQAKTLPHPQEMGTVSCSTSCHSTANSDMLQGSHAEALAKGNSKAPTCVSCHGGHDILPKTNRLSRTYPLNVIKVCGSCHGEHQAETSNGHDGKEIVSDYLDSVHGKAITEGGMAVAATCADCHGSHKVLPANNATASVNRANVAETCGKCHVGLSEMYVDSIHGQELAKGNDKAPVCTDCHTAHAITRTDTPKFMLDIVNECGTCHDKPLKGSDSKTTLYQTYRKSYHGQVTELGFVRGARCSDCHGAHDVKRVDDPKSHVVGDNKVETCKKCHENATPKFAQFVAHADYRDSKRQPLLHGIWLYFVIMMSAAFGFFGLHCILWFGRSVIERIKHGPHPKPKPAPYSIQRFNKVDRINHALVIISFFGLTITGLPLLYSDKAWARFLIDWLGGVKAAGTWHRFFAIMLIANFVIHGFGLLNRIRKHGLKNLVFGPTTMLPTLKDAKDCLGMFKWFFLGGKKPKFDRWTYWEKFDYMAEVGGSGIIGVTGLLLWFPEFFGQYVPGWIFNAATVIHGYEALLAIGFIFTIHFFNAHLRLEKFPVDDVMFTGRMPEEEFIHERTAEYERMVAEGKLEELKVKPPHPYYRVFAVTMGIVAMAIGTTLVVLIILAGLGLI